MTRPVPTWAFAATVVFWLVAIAGVAGTAFYVISGMKPDPQYAVVPLDTPQSDGTVWHQFIRINAIDGTKCSLNGFAILNRGQGQEYIYECKEGQQ